MILFNNTHAIFLSKKCHPLYFSAWNLSIQKMIPFVFFGMEFFYSKNATLCIFRHGICLFKKCHPLYFSAWNLSFQKMPPSIFFDISCYDQFQGGCASKNFNEEVSYSPYLFFSHYYMKKKFP